PVLVSSHFSSPAPSPTHPYPLSLHDALPISVPTAQLAGQGLERSLVGGAGDAEVQRGDLLALNIHLHGERAVRLVEGAGEECGIDRKSTRLNSSHVSISYAVFCLKKKRNAHNISTCYQRIILHDHLIRHP